MLWLQWSPIVHITVFYVRVSSLHHSVDVEMVMVFFCIAHTTFLNLDNHMNVCSQLIVLYVGCSSFILSGVYISLHRASLWLQMYLWSVSIIFWTSCLMNLRSPAWVEKYSVHIMHNISWGIRTCNKPNVYTYPAEEVVVLPLPNDTYCHKTK